MTQEKKTDKKLKKSNLPPGPGPGRTKGVPNKITNDVRQFVLDVANRFNEDASKSIDTVDKNLFWGTIFPKIIPKDINVQAQVWTRQLSDDELVKRIEQLLEKRGERA